MTNKEALVKVRGYLTDLLPIENYNEVEEIMLALQQEPCEDCIRRSDISLTDFEIAMCNGDYKEGLKILLDKVKNPPPVTPHQKRGKWIIIDDCERFIAKCSECGRIEDSRMISKYPYCHCGAKMSDVKE